LWSTAPASTARSGRAPACASTGRAGWSSCWNRLRRGGFTNSARGATMFKWICLAVAVVFLSVLAWMLNDMRLELQRSSELLRTTAKTINEHLPAIVDKTRKTTDSLAEHLPEIVQKLRTTTSTVAELTEDIRQMRELVGLAGGRKRDDGLMAYASS